MKYKEPFIKVTWEDYPENFTKQKINSVKHYFQKKYNTRHVHVKTSPIININNTKLTSLDITENISDFQYQKKLMLDFINENGINVDTKKINKLDDRVNQEVEKELVNKIKYNKWQIKNIRFSNFLSYGEDNYINFDDLSGISVVESTPKNFGGKTTLSVDLLMFLFFNKTTKTKTTLDIFNTYTDKNTVYVRGEINIDDIDYVIERKIIRKEKRNGDFGVKNELEFYKIKENGEIENLVGEQRRETESFITDAIGTEEDFLSTILTTGHNLEQLIESKPTARGQILTKFLGLENLRTKEEIAKKIFNDWSKKNLSSTHNLNSIETDVEEFKISIKESETEITRLLDSISANEILLQQLETDKEKYLSAKNNDVDVELIKTNPTLLQGEIDDINIEIGKKNKIISEINVIEPTTYYLEEEHNKIKDQIGNVIIEGKGLGSDIERNQKLIKQLKEGTICPTCKRPLDGVNHDAEIKVLEDEISNFESEKTKCAKKYKQLTKQDEEFAVNKKVYDDYEKNKLLKSRYELEIDQKKLEISIKTDRLKKYDSNKKKLEENQIIERELIWVNTKIQTCKAEIKIGETSKTKHTDNIAVMKERIKTSEEKIKKLKEEEEYSVIFKIYLSIFGKNGISKEIVRNIIPLINDELHKLLYDSCNFFVELSVNEKHEIEFNMVDNETLVSKPLESGSGYEKTIASLALRSVLTKVSSLPKPNIVVMDEVFGKIADDNLELVGEFFKKIRLYFDNIFVISHNPLIRNWSDNIIMVKKEENVSSIDFINSNNL